MAADAIGGGGVWRCEDAGRWQETLSGGAWRCEDASRWQETLSGGERGGVKTPVGGRRRYLGGGERGGVKTPVGGRRRYLGGGGAWRCEDASRWQETLSGGGRGGVEV